MANHKSALKRIRQSEKRRVRNKTVRTAMRTVIKECRAAFDSGDAALAKEKFVLAERTLQRAATKGVIPRARADRNVSRLAKRLNAVASS